MAVGNFTYTRTTNATVLNQSGVLETVTANNATFAFDADGEALGLTLEEARTNFLLYSIDLSNAYWTKQEASVSTNVINSPDGTQNADLLTENTANANHAFFPVVDFFVTGTTYTTSLFIKANGRNRIAFVSGNSDTCPRGTFNLGTLTATATGDSFNARIVDYGNDWYRLSVSRVAPNTGLDVPLFQMLDASGNATYTGDGTSGMYIWGAQIEAGAMATSFIYTVDATVTRTVSTAIKNAISSQVGQSQGTVYAQVNTFSYNVARVIASTYDNSNNELKIGKTNTGAFFASYKVGGTETVNVVNATANRSGDFKLAAAYNSTGMQLFINGVNGGSNTANAVTGFSNVALGHDAGGSAQFNEPISAFVLFTRRLATNELTSLTS
jgi:hypothetical protein